MRKFRDAVLQVGCNIASALIVTALSFIARSIWQGDQYTSVLPQAVAVGFYAVLVILAAYILRARRASFVDPQLSIPRFGRLTKTVTLLALVLAIIPLALALVPYSMPEIQIRAENQGPDAVMISDHAEFFLRVPESPLSDRVVATGRCELRRLLGSEASDRALVIPPSRSLYLRGRIVNPRSYRRFFDLEYMTLQLVLHVKDGRILHAEVPFTRHSLERHWIMFEIR